MRPVVRGYHELHDPNEINKNGFENTSSVGFAATFPRWGRNYTAPTTTPPLIKQTNFMKTNYLYISNEKILLSDDIIGIFDTDTSTVSPVTRSALRLAEAEKRLISVTREIPKSFILTDENNENKIYMSQISPKILKKRATKGIV